MARVGGIRGWRSHGGRTLSGPSPPDGTRRRGLAAATSPGALPRTKAPHATRPRTCGPATVSAVAGDHRWYTGVTAVRIPKRWLVELQPRRSSCRSVDCAPCPQSGGSTRPAGRHEPGRRRTGASPRPLRPRQGLDPRCRIRRHQVCRRRSARPVRRRAAVGRRCSADTRVAAYRVGVAVRPDDRTRQCRPDAGCRKLGASVRGLPAPSAG